MRAVHAAFVMRTAVSVWTGGGCRLQGQHRKAVIWMTGGTKNIKGILAERSLRYRRLLLLWKETGEPEQDRALLQKQLIWKTCMQMD